MSIEFTPDRSSVLFVYSEDPSVTINEPTRKRYGVSKKDGGGGCLVLYSDAEKVGDPTLFELRPLSTAQVLSVQKLSDAGNDEQAMRKALDSGLVSINSEKPPAPLVFYIEAAINQAVIDLSLGKLDPN
jgi:hypothetical protein